MSKHESGVTTQGGVVNVELRLLRSFVTVAEELNFTRAATRLFIAQQALSSQIQQLERAVGTKLLERSTRHVDLTAAGQVLLVDARRILSNVDVAIDRARRVGEGKSGSLRIAYTVTAAYEVLPLLVAELRRAFPEIEVDSRETFGGQIVEMVASGQCDLGIAQEPQIVAGVDSECLREENLALLVADNHRLATRETVRLGELEGERLGIWPRDIAPGFYDRSVRYWALAGLSMDIDTSATGTALWKAVAGGRVVTFAPASVRGQEQQGTIAITVEDECPIGLYAIWSTDGTNPATNRALDIARRLRSRRRWSVT